MCATSPSCINRDPLRRKKIGRLAAQDNAAHDAEEHDKDGGSNRELEQSLLESPARALDRVGTTTTEGATERGALGLEQDDRDQHDGDDDGDQIECDVHVMNIPSSSRGW